MEFIIETAYDQPAMKALAKGLRKTLRKKRSRRSHILGIVVIILGSVLLLSKEMFDFQSAVTAAAVIAIIFALFWEDALNGHIAKKRSLPGLEHAVTTFRDADYHSVTELGETTFFYDRIQALAETKDHYIFIFSPNHGQVYSKSGLIQGTEAEFKLFIEKRTNLSFTEI